ncbi:bifunctional Protein kinase domain/Protein kinase [Babesia duncani]|uniref:Bifunctional Protein kinase domain/Protein kinase n=1 Tax=Babesia duncani TaxID=323732 RepID=A0AAD9PIN4_9APIC|nr:bifunctional Protein kinase domain/Protein kinase [Babesia duncani]
MGNCCSTSVARLDRVTTKLDLNGRVVYVKNGITNLSRDVVDYCVPDISDVFYTGLKRPIYEPLDSNPSERHEAPIRNFENYPSITDYILTKDLWRSRVVANSTLSSRYCVSSTCIGFGIGGSVRHVLEKNTQHPYALKSLRTHVSSRRKLTSVFNEVAIYTQLDHPHIAFLHEVYQDNDACHILMEYCRGNELYDRLDNSKRFSEAYARKVTFQMLLAISYLHHHGICHRDLKLENWVFQSEDPDSMIKMIDFGFARLFEEGVPMGGMHGTVYYVDPEVIDGCYSEKCDIWSTGVIVYMILSGSPPFRGDSDKEILWRIKRGNLKFQGTRWSSVSYVAKEFIASLLNRNASKRLTAQQALNHKWLKQEMAAYNSYKIPKELLETIVAYSKKNALIRAITALIVINTDRSAPMEVYNSFMSMNISKNGVVTFDEFKKAMSGLISDTSEISNIFTIVTFRCLTGIHYTEFVSATYEYFSKLNIAALAFAFKKLEVAMGPPVVLDSLLSIYGKSFGDVATETIFSQMDSNKDGIVSFQEVCFFSINHNAQFCQSVLGESQYTLSLPNTNTAV